MATSTFNGYGDYEYYNIGLAETIIEQDCEVTFSE